MPAIPGKRISSVSAGPSRFVRMGHDGQSRYVNQILPGSDSIAPPGFDFKITSGGDFVFADDFVSKIEVV